MTIDIRSKTSRTKLQPRREPYWARIEEGFFVGYRRLAQGAGTWIARLRVDDKQKYHSLGSFDDFDAAQNAARAWRSEVEHGVVRSDQTVEDVCKVYVEHRRVNNGPASAKDAEGRLKRLVYGKPIGKIPLLKLRTTDVRKWLNAQLASDDDADADAARRSKDSANRNLATLKAALNLALKDRLVATDSGWKTVTPFRGVGRRRAQVLTHEQRAALLATCPPDVALLVKGLLLTAARPGELAKVTVADFDSKLGTLTLDGKTGRRSVPVSTAAKVFLADQCKGKLPGARLFTTAYGKAWGKDDWKKPFKQAARDAKLPVDVVMYTLRHTAISEQILGGMTSGVVAMLAGTSTAMIDRHYGHLMHQSTRQALDRVVML